MNLSRRNFFKAQAASACGVGLLALGVGLYSRKALPAQALRPPGALPETEFLPGVA